MSIAGVVCPAVLLPVPLLNIALSHSRLKVLSFSACHGTIATPPYLHTQEAEDEDDDVTGDQTSLELCRGWSGEQERLCNHEQVSGQLWLHWTGQNG